MNYELSFGQFKQGFKNSVNLVYVRDAFLITNLYFGQSKQIFNNCYVFHNESRFLPTVSIWGF